MEENSYSRIRTQSNSRNNDSTLHLLQIGQEVRSCDADGRCRGLTSVSSLRATLMLLLDRKERDRRLHKEMSRTDCWKRKDAESQLDKTESHFTPSRVRGPASLQPREGHSNFLLYLSRRLQPTVLPRRRTALNSRNTTVLLHLPAFAATVPHGNLHQRLAVVERFPLVMLHLAVYDVFSMLQIRYFSNCIVLSSQSKHFLEII